MPYLVRRCWDKSQATELFTVFEFNIPACVYDWHEYSSGFVAFIKPRRGSSAIDAHIVYDARELECRAKRSGDHCVVQPFVAGR